MTYTKEQIIEYSKPISDTEKEQCINAINMVKDALKAYGFVITTELKNYDEDGYAYYYEFRDSLYSTITAIIQGSYGNNTNIKRYSDVDISIVKTSRIPLSLEETFYKYKKKIYNALSNYFSTGVKYKNKSIRVEGNTYRKSIDVVPAYSLTLNLENGIEFLTDDGDRIVNYPLLQIKNENAKNKATNYYFKKYVRIFKNIKKDMEDSYISSAKKVGSFQLESLIWNVPNTTITKSANLAYGVYEIINYLIENRLSIKYYKESNGIKRLCLDDEKYINIINYLNDIKSFYNYE